MNKIIAFILCITLIFSCSIMGVSATDSTKELKFNKDGTFKILQIADLQDRKSFDKLAEKFLIKLIEQEKPDLIALTGDNIGNAISKNEEKVKACIDNYMSIFEEYQVPVAAVYGNHDDEKNISKEEQWKIYESYSYFVGKADSEDMSGYGTYNLPIKASDSNKTAFNLWFFDSQTYNKDEEVGGYGCVETDQIEWYKKTEAALTKKNGGTPVPSLAFQHIIIPEVYSVLTKVWETKDDNKVYLVDEGSFDENSVIEWEDAGYIFPEEYADDDTFLNETCCPPKYSNGQADALVENGNVLGILVGHDHVNSFILPYKTLDIIQTPTAGFGSYGDQNRGARVITLNEDDLSDYETDVIFYTELFADDKAEYNHFVAKSKGYSIFTRGWAFIKWQYYRIFG